MHKFFPQIRHPFLHPGHTKFGLTAIMTSFIRARQMSCARPSFLSILRLVSRRRNFTTIGTDQIIRRLQHGINPTTFSSRIGAFAAGIRNSATSITNQCPTAVRLNVALLVGSSIPSDWRSFTRPILGIGI
jgi:hypothetical protein